MRADPNFTIESLIKIADAVDAQIKIGVADKADVIAQVVLSKNEL